ncbi:MAG: hypothetical protein O2931_07845 [Planctomycetota bacterium]|nr:hypothetical protein [Planctomycetota bacterium]
MTLAAVCGMAFISTQAQAALVSVMGAGNILVPNNTPNTGATANFFNDTGTNRLIHGWNERQNVILDRDIVVDIVSPGVYNQPFTSANATITQGTVVSSHLLYFDPESAADRVAQFTFSSQILGIIVTSDLPSDDRLFKTDFLGNPLTLYPGSHFGLGGIEFGPESSTLNPDMQTIRLDLTAANPGDQVRVITRGIPEPATGALAAVSSAIAASTFRRRRKKDHQS